MTKENIAALLLALRQELGDALSELNSPFQASTPTLQVVRRAKEAALANNTVLVRTDVLTPVGQACSPKGLSRPNALPSCSKSLCTSKGSNSVFDRAGPRR